MSANGEPRWSDRQVSFGHLTIAVIGIVVGLALSFGAFMLSNEHRITNLENGRDANAQDIRANTAAIAAESQARTQFDSSLAANLEGIKLSLTDIKVSLAVLQRVVDETHASKR